MKTRKASVSLGSTLSEQLDIEEGKTLVKLARQAITNYLERNQLLEVPKDVSTKLLRKSGTFVTLNTLKPARELRGCIGFPYPTEPLALATIRAAVCAATEDPRFAPVSLVELQNNLTLELTILTPPQSVEEQNRKMLPNRIEVGKHGLIVERGGCSGLLLPQVPREWGWDASEFLTNCCLKAGLPPDSWLVNGTSVKVFEGEIFEETEPAGEVTKRLISET